jgi:hypothetical protein
MTREGVNWPLAVFWTFLAALGTSPSWMVRPNLFTILALVLVTGICEQYHAGLISARRTLWLLPIFLLWPNLHGGFLAGFLVLGVAFVVECALAVASPDLEQRDAARKRLGWWAVLGVGAFAMTLVNPYGIGLHLWNLKMIRDPFMKAEFAEWSPPRFTDAGWFRIELLVLLFPTLAVLSRRRIGLLSLALGVAWLHLALTTMRYGPLWVVVIVPTLAALSAGLPWLEGATARPAGGPASDAEELPGRTPVRSPSFVSFAFAVLLLAVSPWLGNLAGHGQRAIPSRSLDKLLEVSRGDRVFNSANWGGYLTWHGWNLRPRFKPWIDDRLDIHGRGATARYHAILEAKPDWEEVLGQYGVKLLCIPPDAPLASRARESPNWRLLHEDGNVVIFRHNTPGAMSSAGPPPQDRRRSPL